MFSLSFRCGFVALLLLNLSIAGCDRKGVSSQPQIPTVSPSEQAKRSSTALEKQRNNKQQSLPESPQKMCGDSLPKDVNSYPASFYPVFVDYSKKNLELVKKHFCEDAIEKVREKTGKSVIQVASFTSLEKVNQFKEKLSQHFNGVDVGEPTVVESLPATVSKESFTKFPGLSLQQLKELRGLIGYNNKYKIDFKVVLPTYLPDGYQVRQFSATTIEYELKYCNFDNQCFSIRADNGQWGDGLTNFSRVEVSSLALGDVTLEYIKADDLSASSFATFRKDILRKDGTKMMSYSMGSLCEKLSEKRVCSKSQLSLPDAVKIVKSLQYANSNLKCNT
jgi:predicted small lipoprotein YifL